MRRLYLWQLSLLHEFGSLQGLLHAPVGRLLARHGLGPARVARLKAIAGLLLHQDETALRQGGLMSDVASIARFLKRQIGHSERELFGALFLTSRHELIAWEVLFAGSIDRAHVHPREVLKPALRHNAAAVVLAHNHPSGIVDPSQADLRLTADLKALLERVDLRVLDHLIVAPGAYVSFAARGLI
ncbi:MAG: DNA repair protein RadC [Pseudomonadota bacterium]